MYVQVITAKKLWTGSSLVENPEIHIEDGKIASIVSRTTAETQAAAQPGSLNLDEATLAPAFFDVHFHGSAGHDVMEATPEALGVIGGFLATRGVAQYLATTVTASIDATLQALDGLAGLIEKPAACSHADKATALPIGIHLEGPFISKAKCGVQPVEHILEPGAAIFDRFFEASRGHIHLMTLAPELPGAAELAAHASSKGVRVSMGHSNATSAETKAAIDAGAASATHTFNAMRPFDHREPGIIGQVLTNDAVYAELICDGIHVSPDAVRLWYRAKGAERAILVTDAMSAAGMPDGEYSLGGFPVQVTGGKAMARGVLAGSTLTLDRALANLVRFTGAPILDALRLLTVNPAKMTGMSAHAGSIAVGSPAHLVAVNAAGQLQAAVVGGRLA
jgi:N-acetylglucosamine-6-phosphate deacetylase